MFQLQKLFFVEDYEDEATRNLVDVYQIFAGACCFHLQSRRRIEKSRVGEGMRYLSTKLQGVTFQKRAFFHSRRCDKLTSLIIPFNVVRSRNKTTYDYLNP